MPGGSDFRKQVARRSVVDRHHQQTERATARRTVQSLAATIRLISSRSGFPNPSESGATRNAQAH